MQQRKHLRCFDRLFRTWSTCAFYAREWSQSQMQSTDALHVATSDLRTPRRRFCPYRCWERRSASIEEGPWGEPRGLARFTLPECRGRVFGRDTKVCAPRIPWLRLPGWANICISRRRDFAAKSCAAFSKSRRTFAFGKYLVKWWWKTLQLLLCFKNIY